MDLINYAKTHGGTGTAACPVFSRIADAAGCSRETLYLIALGHKTSSGKLARRICDACDGLVHPGIYRPDIFGQPPAADREPKSEPKSAQRAQIDPNNQAQNKGRKKLALLRQRLAAKKVA